MDCASGARQLVPVERAPGPADADHVERVGDLHGVGQHRVEHRPIRRRQIERRPTNPVAPRLGSGSEPGARLGAVAAGDDIEQLATLDVDDLRRPQLGPVGAVAGEQRRIEADGTDLAEAVGVVDQRLAVDNNGVHHGVPITRQIRCHLRHGPSVAADLEGRPARRPRRQLAARRSDPRILLRPRRRGARRVGATPALLVPHQPGRPAKHRQIDQLHRAATVIMCRGATGRTGRALSAGAHGDAQPRRPLTNADHLDVGQPTSSSHIRVGSDSNRGSLDEGRRRHRQRRRAPVTRQGPTEPSSHPQIRSARYMNRADSISMR